MGETRNGAFGVSLILPNARRRTGPAGIGRELIGRKASTRSGRDAILQLAGAAEAVPAGKVVFAAKGCSTRTSRTEWHGRFPHQLPTEANYAASKTAKEKLGRKSRLCLSQPVDFDSVLKS